MIMPKVAIVGRTNVGKSTLFNRLSNTVKTVVHDVQGVTRDIVKTVTAWQGKTFELIDTGGITIHDTRDVFVPEIRRRAMACLESADIILFMCDGTAGITQEDEYIGRCVRKTGKKTILVVNKEDAQYARDTINSFSRFGFTDYLTISAMHGTGIAELLESIIYHIPEPQAEIDALSLHEIVAESPEEPRIVLLGKPNVGKSSLLNVLIQQERAIVSPVAGTTRDVLKEKIRFYQHDIIISDTPGIRRKKAVDEPLEKMMVKSSFHALNDADIVLLLIDSSDGILSDQELKLAFYTFKEQGKALVILYNKQDLVTERSKHDLDQALSPYAYFLKKIVSLPISCKTGYNIGKIIPMTYELLVRYRLHFSEESLTMLFKKALIRSPIFKTGHQLHVYKASQVKTGPITIALTVNNALYFDDSSLSFFENILRAEHDLKSVPVRFVLKKKFVKK